MENERGKQQKKAAELKKQMNKFKIKLIKRYIDITRVSEITQNRDREKQRKSERLKEAVKMKDREMERNKHKDKGRKRTKKNLTFRKKRFL